MTDIESRYWAWCEKVGWLETRTHGKAFQAGFRAGAIDMQEQAIAAIPGGSIADPQQIADAIRAIQVEDE